MHREAVLPDIPAPEKILAHRALDSWKGMIAYVLLVLASATPVKAFQGHQAPERQSKFSVQVDLISLDVEVLNENGEPVRDLTRSDFAIREDGKPREISSFAWVKKQPVSLTVVLDTAAVTMERLSQAREYVTLLAHLLAPEDEICLYTYDYRDARLELNFTRERSALVEALENIGVTPGKKRTFFREQFGPEPQAGLSVDLAILHASQGGNERKAILVVSDRHKGLGEATADHVSRSDCAIYVLNLSGPAGALVDLEADPSHKGLLARESGGRQFMAQGQEMTGVCRTIAYALKNHYTITFLTEIGAQPQAPRRIEVLLPGRDCIIHARRSYTIQAGR